MSGRRAVLALCPPLAVLTLLATAVPSEAGVRRSSSAPPPTCTGSGVYSSPADLDGDAASDVVVGVPTATQAGHVRAGAVDIHFAPGTQTRTQTRTQRVDESRFDGTPAANDAFGSALTFLDANGDRCADLAVGAPGVQGGRGTVTVALGSNTGLTGTGVVTLVGRTPGERFGSAVVATGRDLWISAPNRTVSGAKGAGAVDHYRVVHGAATLVQTLTEDTPGVHGGAEAGDGFGQALDVSVDGPLVVGEPGEDVGAHAADAGTVTVVFANATGLLSNSSTFSQNSPGVPGTAEAGDRFGAAVTSPYDPEAGTATTVAIGVPDEALGSVKGAGTVDTFTATRGSAAATNAGAYTQNSPGVPGGDEAYDHFGAQVTYQSGALCVGAPGEDIGTVADAGDVLCKAGNEDQPNAWTTLRQGHGELGGSTQRSADFGTLLSRLPHTQATAGEDNDPSSGGGDLVIAVPGAAVSGHAAGGQVSVESGVTVTDSGGPVTGGRFGVPAFVVDLGPHYSG